MTTTHRSRRHLTVAAVLTAAAALALLSAPQGFAAAPGTNGVAFDPQPDPPGCRLKVELLPPSHGCAAIIIHYNQPVDPDGLAGKR